MRLRRRRNRRARAAFDWREAQEADPDLARLFKETWLTKVERLESVLLVPLKTTVAYVEGNPDAEIC